MSISKSDLPNTSNLPDTSKNCLTPDMEFALIASVHKILGLLNSSDGLFKNRVGHYREALDLVRLKVGTDDALGKKKDSKVCMACQGRGTLI